jgi:hypothetical protein
MAYFSVVEAYIVYVAALKAGVIEQRISKAAVPERIAGKEEEAIVRS